MSASPRPVPVRGAGIEAAAPEVAGRCYRCGRPTSSPAVGLCDECNPTGIAGPTATQVHGLILASVAGALVAMAIAAKLLTGASGPYGAAVLGQAAYPNGMLEVVVRITNDGDAAGRPTCSVLRGPGDPGVEFLADLVEPGASMVVTRHVAALADSPPNVAEVRCR